MKLSAVGRVGGAGSCPTIRAGIVSPAGVQDRCQSSVSAPDNHFTAGPHCRVRVSGSRARWWCWWLSNCPCWDCISRRCSNGRCHHIRPRRSFHCRSRLPCDRLGQRARWWCWWLSNYPCRDCISRRCSHRRAAIIPAPDDHFTASPNCRVTVSGSGRVGGAGGCPTIRAGIVSPAGVQQDVDTVNSAPDDHFTAGPDCRVMSLGQRARWWCW